MAGLVSTALGLGGCMTMPVHSVQTFDSTISDMSSVATVTVSLANSGFVQHVSFDDIFIESIDGRKNPKLKGVRVLQFLPGRHTMYISGGMETVIAMAGSPTVMLPRTTYDAHTIDFTVKPGGSYQLIYDVNKWPKANEVPKSQAGKWKRVSQLRLTVIDNATGQTIARSGWHGVDPEADK